MRRFFLIYFFALFIFTGRVSGQWEKVYSNNTWASGSALYTHNDVIFQTGYSGGSDQTLRSGDNGISWTDISSSFPYTVYFIQSYENTVLALTTASGTTKYSFYISTDDGLSWSEKSNIDRGSGNGAILSMSSDGNNLFAVSNRRSIYKSVDGGATWNEIIVTYPGTSGILSFAASGNKFLAVLEGDGSVLSTDGGINWSLTNSISNISQIYKLENDIWGIGAGFTGIFKFNSTSNLWENNYLPSSFSLPISIGANETKLISTFGDFLTGNRKYYSSNDFGNSWTELTPDTIGLVNNITSRFAVTANSSFYFAGSWKNTNKGISYSVFRLPIALTSSSFEKNTPKGLHLEQNYPNPFNPTTNIEFSLPQFSHVSLMIFDMLGNEVKSLINSSKEAGNYQVSFNASSLPSGIYFFRLETDGFSQSKKMLLLK